MHSLNIVIALPTADRTRAYAFAQALGLETPGELAEDGVPEPLRVQLNAQTSLMYIPTGGFGWVTAGRTTAPPTSSECLISLQVASTTEVDDIVGRAETAGGQVVSAPEQKAWGYTGTFADPDGHLWEAIVSSRTDSASRFVAASPDRAFDALVDAEALLAWLPPSGMSARFEHFDLRPGGSYRMTLTYDDPATATGKTTADSDVVEARILEVSPARRVVQGVDFDSDDPTFAGTMTMIWEVTAVEGGSRVDIRAVDVPVGISAEDHAAGLASSLANLATFLET